jgi:flavodoxin
MKHAIIFYSYSGNTSKIAVQLKKFLELQGSVELIELKADDESSSFWGQCNRAFFRKEAKIQDTKSDLSAFDLICFGTPVWAFGSAPAMNTYINKCTGLENKTISIFTTHGSGIGNKGCVATIQKVLEKKGAKKFQNFSVKHSKVNNNDYLLDIFNKAL